MPAHITDDFLERKKYTMEQKIKKVFKKLNNKYPYKSNKGVYDCSQHRDGMADAFDLAEQEVLKVLNEDVTNE
jgi:hypothetical protein